MAPRKLLQWPILRYLLGRPRVPVISELPLSDIPLANLAEGESCRTAGGVLVDSAQLHQAGHFFNNVMSPAMIKQFEDSVEKTRLGIPQNLNALGNLKLLIEDEVTALRMLYTRIKDLEDGFKNMVHDVDFLTLLSHNVRMAAKYTISANSSLVPTASPDDTRKFTPTFHSNSTATVVLDVDETFTPSYTAPKGI
ncbi:hypothetical protein BDQ12DRAFT_739557 [Crucibulum laeve]|uniref:Uncharacterized protein n=1 Tax=Crucibulum laeve TaxID=68775 RepID=A0A5C3LGB6_9AGAR|nr:hypothetical protein BDQ12DRAFT_739557 [Crucibulum laeve]